MSTKAVSKQSSLKRRIRRFYDSLNKGDFRRCYLMIDPRVRRKASSVTLFQYENSLRAFLDRFGSIGRVDLEIDVHLSEPNKLYEGRDFAVGKTTWTDRAGEQHAFSERWVWEGRAWYTRTTGLLAPTTA